MPVPAPSQIGICNTALRRARASTINSITEQSNEADTCKAFYSGIIARALEGPHNWSFARQRIQLALAGTNDRQYEWLYAYLAPANMAAAIRVLPDLASLGIAIPLPVPGEPYSETWATLDGYELPYEILDGTIYCNAENAWLDFTINDIDGIVETNLFADAVAYELAAEIAMAIKGDSQLQAQLASRAELAWQRAISADRNRQPEDWGNYLSEAMVARHDGAFVFPGPGRAA